jgi:hypothetical protein
MQDTRLDSITYLDRLTVGSCLAARRWSIDDHRVSRQVVVLEEIPRGVRGALLRWWAWALGLRVEQAAFFVGDLRDDRGESIFRRARRDSALLALRAAEDIVTAVPRLVAINTRHGRDTLRLYLAQRIWMDIEACVCRLWVAWALARADQVTGRLVLATPTSFGERCLVDAVPNTSVRFWKDWRGRMIALASAMHGLMTMVVTAMPRPGRRFHLDTCSSGRRPGVLLIQEDDLGVDRSVRTQPHWLFPSDTPLPFHTYVWRNDESSRLPIDEAALSEAGVTLISTKHIRALVWRNRKQAISMRLTRDALGCFVSALTSHRGPDSIALAATGKLLLRSQMAVALCRLLNIRVFLSGESYLRDVNAVHLVAPLLGLRTVSYQYSNISLVSPSMMATSDLMLLFSEMYRRNFAHDGIAPVDFLVLGYPYDSAFPLVSARAAQIRTRMANAGARFVICYMDESVQHSRWGLVSAAEHEASLLLLVRALMADSTLGVIVKSQFAWNSPSRVFASHPEFERARATGRYVEVCRGTHRNIMFPAEASLASDMAIGQAIGGTAVLEAALAGRRCLVLNPYQWWGTWDGLLKRGDLVYESLPLALQAIAELRAGDPRSQALGDWSSILPEFDPYRDGRAAHRFRTLLERLTSDKGIDDVAFDHQEFPVGALSTAASA